MDGLLLLLFFKRKQQNIVNLKPLLLQALINSIITEEYK